MSFQWHGMEVRAVIEARVAEAARGAAEILLARAQQECPVDTGRLRASGHVEEIGPGDNHISGVTEGAVVTFNAPYAEFVHEGTARQAPNPWLSRALIYSRSEIMDYWRGIVGDAISR